MADIVEASDAMLDIGVAFIVVGILFFLLIFVSCFFG